MGIVPGQRPVAPAWAALLVVGAALVLVDLARVVFLDLTGSDRPSDRGGAALWNGPADPTNRCLVRGRALPLATVWGVEPHQAGQPGGGVLVRDGRMAPGWLFGAALTPTGVSWAPGVSGGRSGTDRPSGGVDDAPNATLGADGTLTLGDRPTAREPGGIAADATNGC